ncbi:hypothetical protein RND61_15375 [Streptomyces sp. TRM76323]|uniref:Uncharacterized protein n=1 Tax=Streptomyces tamarix TaxID=3078565 RepID=A0ABU3QKY6_9ACTN|nr:hypothetical protein [Streptomyces tamarix]MDT9683429.1 hypothetical protein [Streptomyces tamarix]
MANKGKTILQELYENKLISSKVNTFLDDGKTLEFITKFINSQGINISRSSVDNYKSKREESIATNVPLGELLDKRKRTGNVLELAAYEDSDKEGSLISTDTNNNVDYPKSNRILSDLEVLDKMESIGVQTLDSMTELDPQLLLKVIEAKTKLTGNVSGGITIDGVKMIRLQQQALEAAYTEVLMQYIPEEKHEEVLEKMGQAEQEFYDNMELGAEGRRLKRVMKEAGIDF